MVYNRTIADDNVVYQWVRREIRLASDNSWARHHLKHVSWRSRWIFFCIHLNSEWQVHAKSNELTDAFLACPPDWAQSPSLLRNKCGLPLPGSGTIVPVLWLLFSRLSMLQSFQPSPYVISHRLQSYKNYLSRPWCAADLGLHSIVLASCKPGQQT